jgi:hypothetical protein
MSNIEHLRKRQALLYFKMQENKDRYEFFSNFLLSCDLSHNDLLVLTKHQIKITNYYLESFVSFLNVLISDSERMYELERRNPELYPRGCRDIYFEMHEAYKQEQAKKREVRWKMWARERDRNFKAPRDEDLNFKNMLSSEAEEYRESLDSDQEESELY